MFPFKLYEKVKKFPLYFQKVTKSHFEKIGKTLKKFLVKKFLNSFVFLRYVISHNFYENVNAFQFSMINTFTRKMHFLC